MNAVEHALKGLPHPVPWPHVRLVQALQRVLDQC